MKIVINNCFGGFSLSAEAMKQLVIRKSNCMEAMTPKAFYGGESETYKFQNDWETSWQKDFEKYIDIGDGFMSEENWAYSVLKDGILYMLKDRSDAEVRTDKDLVDVVELLGKEANGSCANLKIVDIPDGIEFYIHDYDGNEHVAEAHKTWS